MIRRLRTALALVLFGLAAWWASRAAVSALDRRRAASSTAGRYPNEWGVRTHPLGRRETEAALAREHELTRTFGYL